MYAAANGLTVEAVAARTDTLHLTLEQVSQVVSVVVASAHPSFLSTHLLTYFLLTGVFTPSYLLTD